MNFEQITEFFFIGIILRQSVTMLFIKFHEKLGIRWENTLGLIFTQIIRCWFDLWFSKKKKGKRMVKILYFVGCSRYKCFTVLCLISAKFLELEISLFSFNNKDIKYYYVNLPFDELTISLIERYCLNETKLTFCILLAPLR